MKVISIGASVIAGAELQSPNNTWPALYAQSNNFDFENLGETGCAAQRVLRVLFESLQKESSSCFYVIHWPTSIRFEYVNKDDNTWKTISPNTSTDLVNKVYYTEINSYLGDKFNTLLLIFAAQQALKNSQHKFAMTVDDNFLYDTKWHNPEYVTFLQAQTKDSVLWFDQYVWSDWAKQKGFPHGVGNHPLELAHSEAFKLLSPIYNTLLKGI